MDISQWWLKRAADGDPIALEKIFNEVGPFVETFVKTHVTDPNDADDVIQTCLIDILDEVQRGLVVKESFEDWVAGVVWKRLARYRETGWECGDPRQKRIETVSLDAMEENATW